MKYKIKNMVLPVQKINKFRSFTFFNNINNKKILLLGEVHDVKGHRCGKKCSIDKLCLNGEDYVMNIIKKYKLFDETLDVFIESLYHKKNLYNIEKNKNSRHNNPLHILDKRLDVCMNLNKKMCKYKFPNLRLHYVDVRKYNYNFNNYSNTPFLLIGYHLNHINKINNSNHDVKYFINTSHFNDKIKVIQKYILHKNFKTKIYKKNIINVIKFITGISDDPNDYIILLYKLYPITIVLSLLIDCKSHKSIKLYSLLVDNFKPEMFNINAYKKFGSAENKYRKIFQKQYKNNNLLNNHIYKITNVILNFNIQEFNFNKTIKKLNQKFEKINTINDFMINIFNSKTIQKYFFSDLPVYLMDIYTILRMFRTFKDDSTPNNIVFVGGSYHARVYTEVIKYFFKKKPMINKISDDNCIKLNKPFDFFTES